MFYFRTGERRAASNDLLGDPFDAPSAGSSRKIVTRVAQDIYCAFEIVTILITGIISAEIYVVGVLDHPDYMATYIWPMCLVSLTAGFMFFRANLYNVGKLTNFVTHSRRAIATLFGAFVTIALVSVVLGTTSEFSRIWYATWLVLAATAIWVLRAVADRTFSRWTSAGLIQRRVAIFGYGCALEKLLADVSKSGKDLLLTGVFGPKPSENGGAISSTAGDIDDLVTHGRRNSLDSIIIAVPPDANGELRAAYEKLSVLPADIKLFPAFGSDSIPICGVSVLREAHFIDLQHKPISGWGRLIKLVEDYVIAAIAAVLLAPLLALIAIAIKIDSPGPVLFKQKRNGLNGTVFEIFKFRTMHVMEQGTAFTQTIRGDGRVTRIGRLLRRTSLDELPQVFNVLRGEMSIVGPRPHPLALNERFAPVLPMYCRRHQIKPGITGWAQVNDHRGPTAATEDMRKRLECDLYYIDNWSPWLDLSIIAATPLIGIIHKNAV